VYPIHNLSISGSSSLSAPPIITLAKSDIQSPILLSPKIHSFHGFNSFPHPQFSFRRPIPQSLPFALTSHPSTLISSSVWSIATQLFQTRFPTSFSKCFPFLKLISIPFPPSSSCFPSCSPFPSPVYPLLSFHSSRNLSLILRTNLSFLK
jgi:hypothetical protein